MARPRTPTLTDGELRIMRVLWTRGPSTAADVVGALRGRRAPAYNTVLTMLRILEQKRFVSHAKSGRAFVYSPLVAEGDARQSAVRHLVGRLFDNSPGQLLLNVLRTERVSEEELLEIRRLLDAPQ